MGLGNGENAIGACDGGVVGGRSSAVPRRLVHEAYPAIAEQLAGPRRVAVLAVLRPDQPVSIEELDDADERLGHAERHWREVEKPLHIHRILLQRSWVDIFRGDFDARAKERAERGPRTAGCMAPAQLAAVRPARRPLGSIWRAEALADPAERGGQTGAGRRTQGARRPGRRLGAALDRPTPTRRMRWATHVSARILAGAFAVAWEWENTELVSELVEYHSARGTFQRRATGPKPPTGLSTATAAVPVETVDEYALVAGGVAVVGRRVALTRLGPLPPLQMDPNTARSLSRYRALACERYGRDVTADEAAWSTWP